MEWVCYTEWGWYAMLFCIGWIIGGELRKRGW